MSFKSKKLFVDGRTDIFSPNVYCNLITSVCEIACTVTQDRLVFIVALGAFERVNHVDSSAEFFL